jgi:hypothetical protein
MGRTCRGHSMSGKWYEDQGLLYYCWWYAGNPPRPINPAGGLSRSPSGQAFTFRPKGAKASRVTKLVPPQLLWSEGRTQTVLARKDHAMKHSNSVL